MDLLARVRQALEHPTFHPEEFERCACALLKSRYSGLSVVEGDHDFGQDGDVPFPLDDPGDVDSRGRLLATTGDPAVNAWVGCAKRGSASISW